MSRHPNASRDPAAVVWPSEIEVYDTHTEGEPTRVVVTGWPQPGGRDMASRRDWMREHQDHLRRAVVCEPRGHEAMVGALLTPPVDPESEAGIVFFNNVGYLNMCGHGLIGVARALEAMGRIAPGGHRFDTPAGRVETALGEDGSVSFRNVPCRSLKLEAEIDVPEVGPVVGDVAWGGNGFFLTDSGGIPLTLGYLDDLLRRARAVASVVGHPEFLASIGVSDRPPGAIDHVEFTAPDDDGLFPGEPCDGRNFVLCPGGEWDRSPCGTGTSARMAVLHQRQMLAPGHRYRHRGITGGVFNGWLEQEGEDLYPHIEGSAWVVSHARLEFADSDPLVGGFSLRGS